MAFGAFHIAMELTDQQQLAQTLTAYQQAIQALSLRIDALENGTAAHRLPVLTADPEAPKEGQVWIRKEDG